MRNATKKTGLRITTGIKAGGLHTINHSRRPLKVRAGIKAGGLAQVNHNRRAIAL